MADEYTGTGSLNTADATEAPKRTQINGFTGKEEPAPELLLSASPGDQRKLAAPPNTEPLPDLIEQLVNSDTTNAGIDLETHQGPSLQNDSIPGKMPLATVAQHDTPDLNNENEVIPPVEHEDIPSANKRAQEEGAVPADLGPYPGQDTAAFNESIEKRLDAEAEKTELPDIEAPVIPEHETVEETEKAAEIGDGTEPQPWIEPREVEGEDVPSAPEEVTEQTPEAAPEPEATEEDTDDDETVQPTSDDGTSESPSFES